MNEALFDLLNQQAGRVAALDTLARFFANYGVFLLAGLLGVLGAGSLVRARPLAFRTLAAAVLAVAITGGFILIAGNVIFEQRPFVGDPDTVLLIRHAADNGFPSVHAALAATIATVGALAWRRWAPLLVLMLLLATVSRVFVGVHLPGDVIAGWFGGAIAGIVAWNVSARMVRNRPVVAERSSG